VERQLLAHLLQRVSRSGQQGARRGFMGRVSQRMQSAYVLRLGGGT
jgi:hypothetical protein